MHTEGLDADMSVEAFLDLPEQLTDAWQNLVYELNPHWYPFRKPDAGAEAEKNAAAPNSVSSASSS